MRRARCRKSRQVLTSTPDIGGVYVSTVNSIRVLRAIEDASLLGRATVITSDLFPALGPFIESGRVAATMYQRPTMQGQLAFQTLYKFLVDGVRPRAVIRMAPHIVMKSNLKLFMDRLARHTAKGRPGRGEPEGGKPPGPGDRLAPGHSPAGVCGAITRATPVMARFSDSDGVLLSLQSSRWRNWTTPRSRTSSTV